MRALPPFCALALLLVSLSSGRALAVTFEVLPPVVEPCLENSLCVTTSWTISGTDAGLSGSFEIPPYVPDPAQWTPESGTIAFGLLSGPAYYARFSRDDILAVLPPGGGELLNGTATLYTSFRGVGLDQTQVEFISTTTGCFVFPDSPDVVTCGDGNAGGTGGPFTYGPGQLAWTQAPLTLEYQVVFSVRKVQPIDPNENLGGFDWSGSVSVVYSRVPEPGAVGLDWVTVGAAGNPADTSHANCGPSFDLPCGAVAMPFKIGKYEVTNEQYAAFLNRVAANDPNELYNQEMETQAAFGGITRSGVSGSYSYSVKPGFGSKPVTFVSFWDAVRFTNWLHNGQPSGLQTSSTTEDGAYTLSPEAIAANSVLRNPTARFFLPNEDEWYKAAYYDTIGNQYFEYPTRTDVQTGCVLPAGDTGNSANCRFRTEMELTNVGAYALSASPNETFDQGGNVIEWNEQIKLSAVPIGLPDSRGLRGGAWSNFAGDLAASVSGSSGDGPAVEGAAIGFRVASLPQCSDGIDNDGDGLTDFRMDGTGDPGCWSADSDTEAPQCNDRIDNDGDELIDLADPGCNGNPARALENPRCGLGFELALLLPPLMGLRTRRRRAS